MKPKTVFITGASRGIGRAIALKFAACGCTAAISCSSSENELLKTADEIRARGGSCIPLMGDVSRPEQVEEMFRRVKEEAGPVDILINNAGISHIGLLSDMSYEDWDRVIRVNLSSAFYCSRQVIPDMVRRRDGRIIQISSVWGSAGASCETAYSASKGGLNSFTKALAKELAPSNIKVNAIACGAIDTQMNQFLSEEERQTLIDEIPSCRLGTPEEVAEFTYTLAHSPSYLTGQIITLDGGWL